MAPVGWKIKRGRSGGTPATIVAMTKIDNPSYSTIALCSMTLFDGGWREYRRRRWWAA